MTALDYILDGLEAELALERELGVRSFEIDRSLLVVTGGSSGSSSSSDSSSSRNSSDSSDSSDSGGSRPSRSDGASLLDFVFLHDKPLSPAGVEMMSKIIVAMGKTAEAAPIVIAPPRPKARVFVVLGGRALKRWFPGVSGAPGQWIKTEEGQDVLITYSPEYILRFTTVTPAVRKIKQDMWTSLKSVLKKV